MRGGGLVQKKRVTRMGWGKESQRKTMITMHSIQTHNCQKTTFKKVPCAFLLIKGALFVLSPLAQACVPTWARGRDVLTHQKQITK